MSTYPFTVAYDIERGKIGCAINQRLLGATIPSTQLAELGDAWEAGTLDGMSVYEVVDEVQWRQIVAHTHAKGRNS